MNNNHKNTTPQPRKSITAKELHVGKPLFDKYSQVYMSKRIDIAFFIDHYVEIKCRTVTYLRLNVRSSMSVISSFSGLPQK